MRYEVGEPLMAQLRGSLLVLGIASTAGCGEHCVDRTERLNRLSGSGTVTYRHSMVKCLHLRSL